MLARRAAYHHRKMVLNTGRSVVAGRRSSLTGYDGTVIAEYIIWQKECMIWQGGHCRLLGPDEG